MKIKLFSLLNLSHDGAVCSILKLNKLHIMLDCGINERYDYSAYNKYKKKVKKVNIILLSHAETQYQGALPYLFFELGCQAEVYSTLPVSDLSLVNTFDFILNRLHPKFPKDKNFPLALYKNIADLYDKIKKVKFRQVINNVLGQGLTIKAYPIGHTIGGCAWSLTKERRNIMYLVTYNHVDERTLNGMDFLNFEEKNIDLLITNSNNIQSEYKRVKDRETEMLSYIEYCMKNQGNVILTCNSTSRMYEALQLVQKLWPGGKGPWNGPVYFFHNFMGLFHLAHSQLEFMSDAMTNDFFMNGDNPFRDFMEQNRHDDKQFTGVVKLCRSTNDIDMKATGKLILVNNSNLFFGNAVELLNSIWNNPKDLLVMMEKNEFYQGLVKHLMNRETPFVADTLDKNFFESIVHRENPEEQQDDMGDVGSVADNETIITEESFNPTHQQALMSSLFGSKGFPSFAFVETKTVANQYGEVLTESQLEVFKHYAEKSSSNVRDNTVDAVETMDKAKFEPYFFEDNHVIIPDHVSLQNTPLKARYLEFDLNGLSDGESMIKIIRALSPKAFFCVNGTPEENTVFKSKLARVRSDENAFFITSEQYQRLDLISNSLEISLSQFDFDSIVFNAISANHFDFMMGRIKDFDANVKTIKDATNIPRTEIELVPSSIPRGESEGDKTFDAYGTVDLEKFRRMLEEKNYNTFYKEGTLCVENIFFIRKESEKICIEGHYSKDFIEIRNLFYSFSSI